MIQPLLVALLIVGWGSVPRVPHFKGTREDRFAQGVAFYQQRMGLEGYTILLAKAKTRFDACAWTEYVAKDVVVMGITQEQPYCSSMRPEELALHETCHVRMMHMDADFMNRPGHPNYRQREDEVARCMKWYGRDAYQVVRTKY